MGATAPASFADLLRSAVTDPGIISDAYRQFHNYSLGNQLLAFVQCVQRGIQPGPLSTFVGWKEKGRHVRKGERAITLCMPVTVKRKGDDPHSDDDRPQVFTRFIFRPNWFVLAQTDGADVSPMPIPSWDRSRALAALNITEVPFNALDGNVQGFARKGEIAISPVAVLPWKTCFHEIAHICLGHTAEAMQSDSDITPRLLREVEAECVAMLCCAALGLPGIEEARGYVQHWGGAGNPIPERSAQRILKTADQILRAGREQATDAGAGA